MNTLRSFILSGMLMAFTNPLVFAQATEQDTTPATGEKFPLPDVPATGSLAIQAMQGTPAGPPIGAAEVEVDLVHQNTVLKTIKTQLDEYGIVVIDDIPLGVAVRPVIRVAHAGVTYQEVGGVMDASQPQQAIDVTCFEVTNEEPNWSIPMRQVMLSEVPEGLKVTEIFVVQNPTKTSWLGTPNPPGEPVTVSVSVPKTAKDIELGTGFHGWCCTELTNGMLINHLPLMPHVTELNFTYILPAQPDGTIDLSVIAPCSVDQMIVMLPDTVETQNVTGLDLGGTRQIADTTVRYYTAAGQSKNDQANMVLAGFTVIEQEVVSQPVNIDAATVIAGLGAVFLVFITAVVLLNRTKDSENADSLESESN